MIKVIKWDDYYYVLGFSQINGNFLGQVFTYLHERLPTSYWKQVTFTMKSEEDSETARTILFKMFTPGKY